MQELAQPFDAAAPTYDDDFSHRRLGRWLRDMVHEHIPFKPGEQVLELGCGTGEDALWMAQQGIHVTATDVSTGMLKTAQEKCLASGVQNMPIFTPLDMNDTERFEINNKYDGVFSNFGAVNCIEDRTKLAGFLSEKVKSGGKVLLVVMSPICLWEIGWHLLHGQLKTAFRRFQKGIPAHVGDGQTVRVWYPSPLTVRREFAPYFAHRQTIGIGTLLPPSYLDHLVERYPITFERMADVDRRFGSSIPMQYLNDHYLIILERI